MLALLRGAATTAVCGVSTFLLTATASAAVPISVTGTGHAGVPVELDGIGTVEFVLDTGAQGTAVYEGFQTESGIPLSDETIEIVGQTGTREIPMAEMPVLGLDGTARAGIQAVVLPPRGDGKRLNGIVGLDVFGDRFLQFDWPGRNVAVHPAGTTLPGMARAMAIDAEPVAGGLLSFPVRVGEVEAVAILDTGASHTKINPLLAEAAGLDLAALEDGKVTYGATDNAIQSRRATLDDVNFGGIHLEQAPAEVFETAIFEIFGVADRPAIIFGLDWLESSELLVDFPARRIWFVPVAG